MRALEVVHDQDPKFAILGTAMPLIESWKPMGAQVLVAIYRRPEKTKSGLILSSKTLDEDLYQGKVGLVLKTGPLAFVEDEHHKFGGTIPQPGDWVLYRIGDTFPFMIGEDYYRFVEDVAIRAIIDRPDVVL